MLNPMLSSLNQGKISQIKQMMSAGNPQMLLNQMMSQNPHVKRVMDYVKANGGDAKAAFYKMAGEMGVNPDDILSQLK